MGDDAYGDPWQDLNRAALALARGDRDEAKELFESGTAKLDALGVTLDPDDRFECDWLQERLQALREQAAAAERAVIDYKAKNNIVTPAGGALVPAGSG